MWGITGSPKKKAGNVGHYRHPYGLNFARLLLNEQNLMKL